MSFRRQSVRLDKSRASRGAGNIIQDFTFDIVGALPSDTIERRVQRKESPLVDCRVT